MRTYFLKQDTGCRQKARLAAGGPEYDRGDLVRCWEGWEGVVVRRNGEDGYDVLPHGAREAVYCYAGWLELIRSLIRPGG